MRIKISCLSMVLAALVSLAAVAQESAAPAAPFGLTWGMQPDALRAHAPDMELDQERGSLRSYIATRVPEGLSNAARYHLLFDELAGLVKVQYLSRLIEADPGGRLGRERYSVLREALREKYGEAEVEEMHGLAPGAEQPPFYACLRTPSCGWWHATYRHGGMKIRLQLHGVRAGIGFISLAYESPGFDAALGRYERDQRLTHENAL